MPNEGTIVDGTYKLSAGNGSVEAAAQFYGNLPRGDIILYDYSVQYYCTKKNYVALHTKTIQCMGIK
jgi:hypothetical protein